VCCHRGTKFRDSSRPEKADKAEYIIPDMRTISFFEAVSGILSCNCTWRSDNKLHIDQPKGMDNLLIYMGSVPKVLISARLKPFPVLRCHIDFSIEGIVNANDLFKKFEQVFQADEEPA